MMVASSGSVSRSGRGLVKEREGDPEVEGDPAVEVDEVVAMGGSPWLRRGMPRRAAVLPVNSIAV